MSDRHELLVTAAELADILRAQADRSPSSPPPPRTRVLDVRWSLTGPDGRDEFERGHIPGAVFVDLETELSAHGPATLGRHPLPNSETLTAAARRWGLNPGDEVVLYDGFGNLSAARAWWVLRDAGLARVRLLDGAFPAWIAADQPIETGHTAPAAGNIVLTPGHSRALDIAEVAEFARAHTLIDARAAERYAGESEPVDPVAGHIPGAINLPTTGNVDDRGYFLSAEDLQSRFASLGANSGSTTGADIAVYCGSGVTASHALFALALAGGEGALYPGSWSQWSNHPHLPVATGSTPG